MNKEFLIQLTNKLYEITLLFPKKEPLRYKMREIADDILAKLPENSSLAIQQFDVLDGFFEVAKVQTWVAPQKILNLQEEYSKVRKVIDAETGPEKEQENIIELPQAETETFEKSSRIDNGGDNGAMNGRQKIILDFLKENGRAQVGQLTNVLPEVTKRTLRRDFRDLLRQGLVERIGERNETFYRLK